jgi:hypothetical protein
VIFYFKKGGNMATTKTKVAPAAPAKPAVKKPAKKAPKKK